MSEDVALVIEVESLAVPIRDFYEIRDQLVSENKTFDPFSLMSVPYHQLYLCCIGNAGDARCEPALVAAEKHNRRARFIIMDEDGLLENNGILQQERMVGDVLSRRGKSSQLGRWEDLSDRQQVWFKLNCVVNHTDSPLLRVQEAVNLLKDCGSSHSLPPEVARDFAAKIRNVMHGYLNGITDEMFRKRIATFADHVINFLPDDERKVCQNESLADYSCTSNCYRVLQ